MTTQRVEVAHTPGPWTFQGVQSTSVGTETIMAKTDALGYVFIADVYPPHNDQMTVYGGERDANARLIAVAPELLALVRKHLEDHLDACHLTRRGDICALVAETHAAIAKAEGR